MLKSSYLPVCVAVLCAALSPSSLLADAFRCGTHLAREGMLAAEIREDCGEPDSVEIVSEPVMARRPNGSAFQVGVTTTEYWIYDRGSRRFPARLTIREGIVEKIELLRKH